MQEMIDFFSELRDHEEVTGDPDFAQQIGEFVEKMEDREIQTTQEAAYYFFELYNTWKL